MMCFFRLKTKIRKKKKKKNHDTTSINDKIVPGTKIWTLVVVIPAQLFLLEAAGATEYRSSST